MNNRKIPQFSKIMVVITTILFTLTLVISFVFMIYMSVFASGDVVEYVVATTALSVVAGLYGLVLKSYLSKSGLENSMHIRNEAYKNIMHTRLEYIEGVILIKQKYGLDQSEIDDIESESPFNDLSDDAINQTVNKINTVDAINDAEPEDIII